MSKKGNNSAENNLIFTKVELDLYFINIRPVFPIRAGSRQNWPPIPRILPAILSKVKKNYFIKTTKKLIKTRGTEQRLVQFYTAFFIHL